jgi:phage-related tail protein
MTATLSEGKATSDRVGQKYSIIVRKQSNFGQCWRNRQQHCQKAKQLRTGLAKMTATLSEGKATSDRIGEIDSNIVRRQSNFGRSKQKIQQHCQKTRQLPTGLAEKTATLSEGKATSDRVSRKTRNIVRREGNFRQGWRKNNNLCANSL